MAAKKQTGRKATGKGRAKAKTVPPAPVTPPPIDEGKKTA